MCVQLLPIRSLPIVSVAKLLAQRNRLTICLRNKECLKQLLYSCATSRMPSLAANSQRLEDIPHASVYCLVPLSSDTFPREQRQSQWLHDVWHIFRDIRISRCVKTDWSFITVSLYVYTSTEWNLRCLLVYVSSKLDFLFASSLIQISISSVRHVYSRYKIHCLLYTRHLWANFMWVPLAEDSLASSLSPKICQPHDIAAGYPVKHSAVMGSIIFRADIFRGMT